MDVVQFGVPASRDQPPEHCRRALAGGRRFFSAARVAQRIGESAQRQIRPLRHKEHWPFAKPDFASAVGPDPGNCTQQSALARAAGTGNQHRPAASRSKANSAQERRTIGHIDVELFDRYAQLLHAERRSVQVLASPDGSPANVPRNHPAVQSPPAMRQYQCRN